MLVETMLVLFVTALVIAIAVGAARNRPRDARRAWRGIRRELESGRVADDPHIADNEGRGRRA